MRLTPEQEECIAETDRHCAVLAIPGSGKTGVLTAKLVALVHSGRTVMAMTFTNEAAEEIRQRALAHLGPNAAGRFQVGTFHGLVMRNLARMPDSPLTGMSLLDEDETPPFKRMALGELGVRATPEPMAWFDACQTRVVDPYGLRAAKSLPSDDPARRELLAVADLKRRVVEHYRAILSANRTYDFNGLLQMALQAVLAGNRLFVADDLLVDEAQDVDEVQLHLVMAHAPWSRIDLVGDDDQSIYRFRHAMGYGAFQTFIATLGAREMTLSVNFRCRAEILHCAGQVIEQNKVRVLKELIPHKGRGARLRIVHWESESQENHALARAVAEALRTGASSVAVLARTNDLLVDIQAPLTPLVKFARVSCNSFWSLPCCVVARALLRAVADPLGERAALEEAVFWCGASAADMAVLRNAADGEPITAVLRDFDETGDLSPDGLAAARLVATMLDAVDYPSVPSSADQIDHALAVIFGGLRDALSVTRRVSQGQEDAERNILRCAESAMRAMCGSLSSRLWRVSQAEQNDVDAPVTLTTMHGSKGREFDAVFILAAADHIIPGRARTQEEKEEERRLLYVAMTRARDALTVSYARTYGLGRRCRKADLTWFLNLPNGPAEEDGAAAGRVNRWTI